MTDPTIRDHIQALTEPHQAPVYDKGRLVGHRDQQPLLRKLRDAKTANIGQGNGSKAAHERITLNVAAADLYASIEKRIRAWARNAGYTRTITWPDPEQLLTYWWAHTYGTAKPEQLDAYEDTLRGWVIAIEDLIVNPPHRWTLGSPCPVCDKRWATLRIDGEDERTDALNVIEREPANHSVIYCKNCGATWTGIDGARTLNLQIDQARTGAA